MVYIGNAFSLQMVDGDFTATVEDTHPLFIPADAKSVIGHADTAAVVSSILGREVPCNRESIKLEDCDIIYVAQLTGGRLPEGATTLPEGYEMRFKRVEIQYL